MTDLRQASVVRTNQHPPIELPPLELRRDEMAFRREYEALLLARTLTTVFRPGDRRWPKRRGYRPGESVTARVIARCGSDALRLPPEFTDARIAIRIASVELYDPATMTPDHFVGSSPDVHDRQSMLQHLLHIYGEPIDAFGGVVTRIAFQYRDDR